MSGIGAGQIRGKKFAKGCLIAYIDGKQSLNWAVGMIKTALRTGDLYSEALQQEDIPGILDGLSDYGEPQRLEAFRERAIEEGWDSVLS